VSLAQGVLEKTTWPGKYKSKSYTGSWRN